MIQILFRNHKQYPYFFRLPEGGFYYFATREEAEAKALELERESPSLEKAVERTELWDCTGVSYKDALVASQELRIKTLNEIVVNAENQSRPNTIYGGVVDKTLVETKEGGAL